MANGTIAVSSIEMLSQSGTGITTIAPPATNSNFTQTLVPITGTLAPLVSGTAVASTSGTSIDFTGIPSWVKRITVMFAGVSTNGTSPIQIQIGAGSITTSGYTGSSTGGGGAVATTNNSTGFLVNYISVASTLYSGIATISTLGSNVWVESGALGGSTTGVFNVSGGTLTLGSALDRIRITTVNGTDAFDAGSINILYE
jgi:hypothetical protein